MTIFKKDTGTQGVPFKYLLSEKNTEWKKKEQYLMQTLTLVLALF